MSILRFNSLIKKYFSDELMNKLIKIFQAKNQIKILKTEYDKFRFPVPAKNDPNNEKYLIVKILSNNTKISLVKNYINMYWRDKIINFGTGTNRVAVMTDNYVFKIALDLAGCVDNLHEFKMSSELYPDVTKTYETNKLICVSEYVQVINNTEEFISRKHEILSLLKRLSEKTSLMLDVGYIKKNMSNLGVRASDDKVVILDFGYIYTELDGLELTCSNESCNKKNGLLDLVYNSTYSALVCPKCGTEYGVSELQSLITEEARMAMYKDKMQDCFVVNKEVSYFEVDEFGNRREIEEVDDEMVDNNEIKIIDPDKLEQDYIDCCEECLRQENIVGYVNPTLLETKEHLRRVMLEQIHGIPYEDLEPELQDYDPYEATRERIDLSQVTGYRFHDDTNELIKCLSCGVDVNDMDEDEYELYRRVVKNNNYFDNEFLRMSPSEVSKGLNELVEINRQSYKALGEKNPYAEMDKELGLDAYNAQYEIYKKANVPFDVVSPSTPITDDEDEEYDYIQSIINKNKTPEIEHDPEIIILNDIRKNETEINDSELVLGNNTNENKQEVEEPQSEAETEQQPKETKDETTTDIIENQKSSDDEYLVEIPMEIMDKLKEELCVKFVSIGQGISKKALEKMEFPFDLGDGSEPFLDYSIDEGNKAIKLHRNLINFSYVRDGKYEMRIEPQNFNDVQGATMSPKDMETDMILDIDEMFKPEEQEDPADFFEKIRKPKKVWK